jgi:hypothetical protein
MPVNPCGFAVRAWFFTDPATVVTVDFYGEFTVRLSHGERFG